VHEYAKPGDGEPKRYGKKRITFKCILHERKEDERRSKKK
jgi:hypothetical protein